MTKHALVEHYKQQVRSLMTEAAQVAMYGAAAPRRKRSGPSGLICKVTYPKKRAKKAKPDVHQAMRALAARSSAGRAWLARQVMRELKDTLSK